MVSKKQSLIEEHNRRNRCTHRYQNADGQTQDGRHRGHRCRPPEREVEEVQKRSHRKVEEWFSGEKEFNTVGGDLWF